jgi:hypothetical protein
MLAKDQTAERIYAVQLSGREGISLLARSVLRQIAQLLGVAATSTVHYKLQKWIFTSTKPSSKER